MAFTGTPVVEQVSDALVRITGVSLDASDVGSIVLTGFVGVLPDAVILPEGFKPRAYSRGAVEVTLDACVEVTWQAVEDTSKVSPSCILIAKAGAGPADFLIEMTNTSTGDSPNTGDLEIYVRYH